MADGTIDNQTLLRRTLITAGAMVGACTFVVGVFTLALSVIVGHAVAGPNDSADAGGASAANAPKAPVTQMKGQRSELR